MTALEEAILVGPKWSLYKKWSQYATLKVAFSIFEIGWGVYKYGVFEVSWYKKNATFLHFPQNL